MSKPTILLVDYDPHSIESTRRPLADLGYDVEVAKDGLAGIEAFGRVHPDLVLLEMMLPKKHGLEVCQEMRKKARDKRTPIVILGRTASERYRIQAVSAGASDYVTRPITSERLVEICNRHLMEEAEALIPAEPLDEADAEVIETAPAPHAPAPATPAPLDLSHLSDDDILARLDALLPTDPGMSSANVAASTAAVVNVKEQVPTTPFPSSETRRAARERTPKLEPISGSAPAPEAASSAPILDRAPKPYVESDRPMGAASVTEPRPAPVRVAETPPRSAEVPRVPVAPAARVAAATPQQAIDIASGRQPSRAVMMAAIGLGAIAVAAVAYGFLRGGAPSPAEGPGAEQTRPSAARPETPAAPRTAEAEAAADVRVSRGTSESAKSVPVAPPVVPAMAKPSAAVPPSVKPAQAASAPGPQTLAASPTAPRTAEAVKESPTSLEERAQPQPVPAEVEPPMPAAAIPVPPPTAADAEPVQSGASDPIVEGGIAAAPVGAVKRVTVAPGTLVALSAADSPPVVLSRAMPTYPALARRTRAEGKVVLRLLVDEHGEVASIEVAEVEGASVFGEEARKAARVWKYSPALKDGVPVKTWVTEKLVFKP